MTFAHYSPGQQPVTPSTERHFLSPNTSVYYTCPRISNKILYLIPPPQPQRQSTILASCHTPPQLQHNHYLTPVSQSPMEQKQVQSPMASIATCLSFSPVLLHRTTGSIRLNPTPVKFDENKPFTPPPSRPEFKAYIEEKKRLSSFISLKQ